MLLELIIFKSLWLKKDCNPHKFRMRVRSSQYAVLRCALRATLYFRTQSAVHAFCSKHLAVLICTLFLNEAFSGFDIAAWAEISFAIFDFFKGLEEAYLKIYSD